MVGRAYADSVMALYVHEIMNHETFTLAPGEQAQAVRGYFAALDITSAPVVDDRRMPIGFVSLRDLGKVAPDAAISGCMSSPADTIAEDATIASAAGRMTALDRHHLAVVDRRGRVVGFVGSLDVLRGLLGHPVPHPEGFPHLDTSLGVSWSDDWPLDMAHVDRAPDGPGLLRLVRSRPGAPDRVVASEARHNVRTRLVDLLSLPQPELGPLVDELERGTLRFRAAATPVPARQLAVVPSGPAHR